MRIPSTQVGSESACMRGIWREKGTLDSSDFAANAATYIDCRLRAANWATQEKELTARLVDETANFIEEEGKDEIAGGANVLNVIH